MPALKTGGSCAFAGRLVACCALLLALGGGFAAAAETVSLTGVYVGQVTYGPEADGRGMLLQTPQGLAHVELGSAECPELAGLKPGCLVRCTALASRERVEHLGISVPQYSYHGESGVILEPAPAPQ